MAKKKRKSAFGGYRTQQQHATLRATDKPGTYEFTLALGALELPENQFYCTSARVKRRRNYVSFIFGQYLPGSSTLKGLVGIDMPYRTLVPLARTFDDAFREKLRGATRALAPPESWTGDLRQFQTASFYAHLARVLVNEFAGVIDFYEMEPAVGNSMPIAPVIRVKSLPYIVGWFVETVDTLVKELASGSSVQAVETSGSGSESEGSP